MKKYIILFAILFSNLTHASWWYKQTPREDTVYSVSKTDKENGNYDFLVGAYCESSTFTPHVFIDFNRGFKDSPKASLFEYYDFKRGELNFDMEFRVDSKARHQLNRVKFNPAKRPNSMFSDSYSKNEATGRTRYREDSIYFTNEQGNLLIKDILGGNKLVIKLIAGKKIRIIEKNIYQSRNALHRFLKDCNKKRENNYREI